MRHETKRNPADKVTRSRTGEHSIVLVRSDDAAIARRTSGCTRRANESEGPTWQQRPAGDPRAAAVAARGVIDRENGLRQRRIMGRKRGRHARSRIWVACGLRVDECIHVAAAHRNGIRAHYLAVIAALPTIWGSSGEIIHRMTRIAVWRKLESA